MNPNEDTTQLNSSVAQLNTALAGLNKARGTSFKSITPVNATIQADKLGKAQPYNVPPVDNASTTGNLAQTTNQYVAQATTNATAPEPTTPVNQNKSKLNSYLEGIMGNISGQADAVNAINKEEDVAGAKKAYLTLKNDLDLFDKEFSNEVKAIKENQQGKFGGAIEQDLRKAQETYDDRRANKVLSVNSALGEYEVASDIATSKIQALKDQNSQSLQAYTLFADSVMNDLTESEKLQVEANIQQKQLQAKTVEDAYSQALSAGLDNGAGQSYFNALDQAKRTGNVASILGTVSQYGYQTLDQQESRANIAQSYQSIAKINQEIADQKVGNITNLNAGDYSQALGVILGSGTFTKDQKKDVINAINNGQDPAAVIKNQAKNIMGQTLATDLDKAETAKAQLESIDSALKEYYANGGKSGVFTGNYEKTINKLGQVKDPKLVGLATEIALAMQSYRLAVTGTAASVQEDARIDNVFPGITSGQVLNNARTQATIKSFDTKIDSSYRNTLGSGYDALKTTPKQGPVKPTTSDPLGLGITGKSNPLGL